MSQRIQLQRSAWGSRPANDKHATINSAYGKLDLIIAQKKNWILELAVILSFTASIQSIQEYIRVQSKFIPALTAMFFAGLSYSIMVPLEAHSGPAANGMRSAMTEGDRLLRLGKFSDAVAAFNREVASHGLLRSTVLDASSYTNRARAYLGLNQANRAVTDLNRVISINPRALPGEAFYLRAQAYAKLGKSDLSAKDFEMARKLAYLPNIEHLSFVR